MLCPVLSRPKTSRLEWCGDLSAEPAVEWLVEGTLQYDLEDRIKGCAVADSSRCPGGGQCLYGALHLGEGFGNAGETDRRKASLVGQDVADRDRLFAVLPNSGHHRATGSS